jgi:predicted component of type VI protein secretion system
MRNSSQLDQNHSSAIRAEIADRLRYLLSKEISSPSAAAVDQIQEQEAALLRLQMMEQETIDPLAVRLLQEVISDMEAGLKEQVNRLVAERH